MFYSFQKCPTFAHIYVLEETYTQLIKEITSIREETSRNYFEGIELFKDFKENKDFKYHRLDLWLLS